MSNNNNNNAMANSSAKKVSAKILGDFVLLKDYIGEGAFAKVFKGYRKSDKLPVAIKVLPKAKIDNNPKLKSSLEYEISILRRKEIDKRYIIDLLAVHKSKNNYYLVMEYCKGGDLASYLRFKKTLPTPLVQKFLSHIAKGLKCLRDLNIVHRDLKPQNLLLTTADDTAVVKIADFGFAREIEPESMALTFCGSPLYMAPEVIDGEKYNEKADLWSVGVILYEMFTGATPYMAYNLVQLSKQIKEKQVIFPANVPKDAVHLLTGLLQRDPMKRISFSQFFEHPFIRDMMKEEAAKALLQQQLSPRENLQLEKPIASAPVQIPNKYPLVNNNNVLDNDLMAAQSFGQTPPSFQLSLSPAMRAALRTPKISPFNAGTLEHSLSPPAEKTKAQFVIQRARPEALKMTLKKVVTLTGSGHINFLPVIFDFSDLSVGVYEQADVKELVKIENFSKQAWAVAEAAYYYEKRGKMMEALSLYIKSMMVLQNVLTEIKNYFKVEVADFSIDDYDMKLVPERLAALIAWNRNHYAIFLTRCEKIRVRLERSSTDIFSVCTPEVLLYHYALKLGRDSGFEEFMADMTNCIAMCSRGKLVFEYLLNFSEIAAEQTDKESLVKYVNLFQTRLSGLNKKSQG